MGDNRRSVSVTNVGATDSAALLGNANEPRESFGVRRSQAPLSHAQPAAPANCILELDGKGSCFVMPPGNFNDLEIDRRE